MTPKKIKPSEINRTIAELIGSNAYEWNQDWNQGQGRSEPLDFLHDSRGTVMLQNRLLDDGWNVCYMKVGDWRSVVLSRLLGDRPQISETDIALAFLKANGVEVEG